jgi:hypothetical protein
LLDAFFFDAKGTKKKALQKRNAASSGAARTRELFKKSSTKNYKGDIGRTAFAAKVSHRL